jgi:hypothetical protein
MNLVNSPREFLPLQFCILTNRSAPDIHDDSAMLSPACYQAAYHSFVKAIPRVVLYLLLHAIQRESSRSEMAPDRDILQ